MPEPNVPSGLIRLPKFDSGIPVELETRDAALWLGEGVGDDNEHSSIIALLASLPWQLVLCEGTSGKLLNAIDAEKDNETLKRRRGFTDLIASNPDEIPSISRSLPVYLLNGRADTDDPTAKTGLTPQKELLRRLAMLKRLEVAQPRMLVVVSDGNPSTLENLVALWDEGFRSRLVYVSSDEDETNRIETEFRSKYHLTTVTVCEQTSNEFAYDLSTGILSSVADDQIVVRFRDRSDQITKIDITECDRIDQPILDRFEVIREGHMTPILPADLKSDEIASFFERSSNSWRPNAAGLPWMRNSKAEKQLKRALHEVLERDSESNKLCLLVSEPGAGGTTTMRHLAFLAASEGYPTLVARPHDFTPTAIEVVNFLFGLTQKFKNNYEPKKVKEKKSIPETPVLITFDAQHWNANQAGLISFFKAVQRAGRSAVFLIVIDPVGAESLPDALNNKLDIDLVHNLTEDEALSLGFHLNKYLEPQGNGRHEHEWRSFHNQNQPLIGDFGVNSATFWIALEFWLKRQLPLGESIQDWIYGQFASAEFSPKLKKLILQIAALTVERVAMPEEMLPPAEGEMPYSLLLENAKRAAPALGLYRSKSESGKQWALGHPQVSRYLLNLAFRDRSLLGAIGLGEVKNAVALRLELLREIACNPVMAQTKYLPIAIEFARNIFKLDRDGNREFFLEWRRVISILEEMPDRVWETNRAFNHHVAISRRRIASDEEYFPLTLEEQRDQLDAAVEHLERALDEIQESQNDDSDLNLLNSLARSHQDLANLEIRSGGSRTAIEEHRGNASLCIRRAEKLGSTNSYVLETLARDLIQNGESVVKKEPGVATRLACESLSYIRQALALDSAEQRKEKLTSLLRSCFNLLSGEIALKEIDSLCKRIDPIGLTAAAWLAVREGSDPEQNLNFTSVPRSKIEKALAILEKIPSGKKSILDLRLAYDLVSVARPFSFSEQLELIESIVLESNRVDLQTEAEFAILLFQCGRVQEGSELFRKIRYALNQSDVFVSIPTRLKFLLKPNSKSREVCSAVVTRAYDVRSYAAVEDLEREEIPFVPRQFGMERMGERQRFQCNISFGANGPFISPPK